MKNFVANERPRILIVDDNAAIHEDFRKILGGPAAGENQFAQAEAALFGNPTAALSRVQFRIDSAFQGHEALARVQHALEEGDPYVLAFVDVRMPPGWDGVETIERIWQCYPDLQTVICTAYSDYSWDDMARRLGPTENLLILKKPFETIEVLQITHALARKWELTRQAKLRLEDLDRMVQERTAKLQSSEERFAKAFQSNPMAMAIQSCTTERFLDANASFRELTGYSAEELIQRTAAELHLWEHDSAHKAAAQRCGNHVVHQSCLLRHCDGTTRNIVLWTEPITLDAGPCVLLIVENVTDQLKMEGRLRQTQKMEAIGRLAAGIAHEFNNILTVIQGHAGLLNVQPLDPGIAVESAGSILQASQRAAGLTGQLLAFSRKQPLQLKPIRLNDLVKQTQKMLSRLLGETHQLVLDCPVEVPAIQADEGNLEQVLMNLVLNARDAMAEGGTIRIATGAERVDATAAAKNPDARPGEFACLTITDTGCGMNAEVLKRIFDPFYTTKDVGHGTGLGLSSVHGIVQQHQGWVEVASQVGRGSTFKIFLPVCEMVPPAAAKVEIIPGFLLTRGAGETVLVVEDETIVRDAAVAALKQAGYQVLEAANASRAITLWEQSATHIDLLVTDLVLPGQINGVKLAEALQVRDPRLQVIYTSGYDPDTVSPNLAITPGVNFLPKPYDSQLLLGATRLCLTHAPGKAALTGTPVEAAESALADVGELACLRH